MTSDFGKIRAVSWSRRDLMKAGAAVSLLSLGLNRFAFAKDAIEFKASLFPPPANGAVKVIKAWGKQLAEKTGNQVNVEVFPSGQMGPPNRQYDLVREGVADLSWVLHGFTPGRFPLIDIANLPGMFETSEAATAAMWRVRDELIAEHKAVRVLGLVASPTLVIMTRTKPIQKPADVKGLRIRPPSAVAAGAIQSLGGVSVAVPPAEMGEALSKGVIDALVTTAEAAASFRLFESIKYVSDVNMGMATFAFVMNPGAYERLPPDLRAALDSISGKPFEQQAVNEFEANETAARAAAREAGTEFIKLSADAAGAFAAALKAHREKVIAKMVSDGIKNAGAVYSALQA